MKDANNLLGFTRRPGIGRCLWVATGNVTFGSSATAIPFYNGPPVVGKEVCTGLRFLNDSVNGSRFVCDESGTYSFTATLGSASSEYIGFSLNANSTQRTQSVVTVSNATTGVVLCYVVTPAGNINTVSTTVGLTAGDTVYPHGNGTTALGSTVFSLIASRCDQG